MTKTPDRKHPKLNMWVRLGIVLSGIWFISAGLYTLDADSKRATRSAWEVARTCRERNITGDKSQDDCDKVFIDYFNSITREYWVDPIFVAATPIVVGWPVIFLFWWLVKWILRGRVLPE